MNIVLYYRGPLHANADAKEKHRIREHFHKQLTTLWNTHPLRSYYPDASNPNPSDPGADALPGTPEWELRIVRKSLEFPSMIKVVAGHQFLPLVCQKLFGIAEVDLTFLRPEPAGRIVTQGGDIDNRIKTLLDALKVPDANQARLEVVGVLESPFHCLLEDDNLITRLAVRTEQLLEPVSSKNEVILLVHVNVRRTLETQYNYVIA
jgi:hypothetical protein